MLSSHALTTRLVALFSAEILLTSSSATGVYSFGTVVRDAAEQAFLGKPGAFTENPRRAYLGSNPSRDPKKRTVWTDRALSDAKMGSLQLLASIMPSTNEEHTLAVAAEPGSAFPWEGSFGSVNSGNGNKLTSLPLFGWKARGGMSVDFTLYHNSQTNYDDELGYGWTWTYDIYINVGGSTGHC